jgi:uncharacterized cupin superfamily protein
MKRVNQEELSWIEQKSPSGKFCVYRKHVSLALGGLKDVGSFGGGHPFDAELARVPPGAANWPFHSHDAQWELFLVLAGRGELRTPTENLPITSGDCVLFPPGEAHQLTNIGDDDLIYYIVSDHPRADVMYYPDSDKYFVKPRRRYFRMQEVDYFAGEDEDPAS